MNSVSAFFQQKNLPKLVGGVIVILAIVAVGFHFFGNKSTKPQYQTATATRGTLVVTVSGSGQVSSVNNSPVNINVSGVINKVYVKNGDHVTAGQPLAEVLLDETGKQKRASAYSTYLAAVASEKNAENDRLSADASMWKDQQNVLLAQDTVNTRDSNNINPATKTTYTDLQWQSVDSGLVNAHKQFTASETRYIQSDSAVNSSKASITSTYLAYKQTLPVIVAPIDGVVDGFSLEVGEVIAPNTSTTATSQKVATIKTQATPIVTINLTEIDVPKVKIGNRVTLTFDALPNKTYTGRVVSIDSASLVSSGVTTYPTAIQLDTQVPELFANMSATANIITQTKDDVVLVPAGAVQTQNQQSTVRVLRNGKLTSIPVEVGLSSDSQTEITSGLSDGDEIVTNVISSGPSSGQGGSASPFGRTFGGGGGGGARIFAGGRGG